MAAQYPRLGVSSGIGGFYAVLYNAEEVINTGVGRYLDAAPAWEEARGWAASECLPCDEEKPSAAPAKKKKPSAPLLAFDDSKGQQKCKSCFAAIWWYELVSGKRHPFDAQADGSAPDYLMTEVDIPKYGRRLVAHIAAAVSHFATCPQSKDWKGKSR